jgi:outer membrane receptor protein involved in Fe transport
MRSLRYSIGLVLAVISFLGTHAFAQVATSFAQLNGTVTVAGGGTVAKATVTLRAVETNQIYSAVSNDSGFYVVPNLPPGRYEVSVEASGFAKSVQTGIVLRVGQTATINVALKIATVKEIVEVNTEVPPIEPTRTEVSQVVETQQIESLPISGRLFTDFALLSPGVTTGRISLQSTFTDPSTTRISFGGQRDLSNSVTVDGADNINTATGSQRATPSQEAVKEFRVVNNNFGAEYGRALGGIVNIVTKSGTNSYHGSVYEYFQNNKLDAKSILTLPNFDTLRQNQFGATFGGPIQKDRTFFFMNYEGQRRAQSPTYPGALVANLDSSAIPGFPNPCVVNGVSIASCGINQMKESLGIAPENLNVLKTGDYDEGLIKIDRELNARNRLSVRYSIEDSTALNMLVGDTLDGGGIGAPSSGRNGLLRDQSLVGTWTSTMTPAVVNSMLLQYARRNYGFPGVTGQPNLDVPNTLLFGHNFGAFDRYNESRVQFSDTLAWVKGKHFPRFGFDTNYIRNFVIWPGFTPARIIFPSLPEMMASSLSNIEAGTGCPPPLPSFLPAPCIAAFFWGAPIPPGPIDPNQPSPPISTSWQNAFNPDLAQNFFVNLNHSYYGMFAQDQWHVTPNLTLNYGLRYDFETGLGFFVDPDRRSFQPRVGIAYSPGSKTVIRAGYGIFYDKYSLTFFFVPAPQRQPVIMDLPKANNQQTGSYILSSAFLGACPPSFVGGPPCPSGTVPVDIIDSDFVNFVTQGIFPNNAPYYQGGTSVDRHLREPYSEQSSLEIDREIAKGLTVNLGYLFVAGHKLVRPIDLNVAPHVGTFPGTNKDIYNFAILDRNIPAPPGGSPGTNGIFYFTDSTGNSVYHGVTLQVTEKAGQYLRLNANYTFSKTLDDGTFVTFVSTPQSNDQRSLERAYSNQDARHRFVANFVATGPQNTFLRNFELSSIITLQSPRPFTIFVGFDANSDGNPVTDRVGLSRRNTYRGDSLRTVDMRLSRTFHFAEHGQLQLLAESFNLFNRANVDEVFSVYGAPDFVGPVPQHYKDGITNVNPGFPFGTPRTTFNPRQIQFAAKFTF